MVLAWPLWHMQGSLQLADLNSIKNPSWVSYIQKTVLHDLFCLCRNSFYWLFTGVLSLYNLISFAAETPWGSVGRKVQILHHGCWSPHLRTKFSLCTKNPKNFCYLFGFFIFRSLHWIYVIIYQNIIGVKITPVPEKTKHFCSTCCITKCSSYPQSTREIFSHCQLHFILLAIFSPFKNFYPLYHWRKTQGP